MALQHNMWLAPHLYPPPEKQKRFMLSSPFEFDCHQNRRISNIVISCVLPQGGNAKTRSNQQGSGSGSEEEEGEPADGRTNKNDPYLMDAEERREWRRKIREVIDMNPDIEEEVDPDEKRKKMQQLLAKYPLVVEEEDPEWPEDADGWGFNLGQFFDKITIKNKPKKDDDDDDNYDSGDEIVWQDDNYIRPIKDITAEDWEETVFKDISPLVIIVHNRYKRLVPSLTRSYRIKSLFWKYVSACQVTCNSFATSII